MEQAGSRALSAREFVSGAIQFAIEPTWENWCRLFGDVGVSAPEGGPAPDYIQRAAETFRADLSAVVHGRQTPEQIEGWKRSALLVAAIPNYVIEGTQVRTEITWRVPRNVEVIDVPGMPSDWICITEDSHSDSRLATVLMWILDPSQPYRGLRECGLGDQCDRERFFFDKRKYCCRAHMREANRSTAGIRKADYIEREKAIRQLEQLTPRFPRARELVMKVREPGLKAERLIELAVKRATEDRTRRSQRKHK